MNSTKFTIDLMDKAEKNLGNIKESINGLYNILKILSCESDNGLFCNLGIENISNLYKNLIELMLNDYGMRQIVKKIKNREIELDIPLDDCANINE